MLSTTVASPCQTLRELLAGYHIKSPAHQLVVPHMRSSPRVCTLVLFIISACELTQCSQFYRAGSQTSLTIDFARQLQASKQYIQIWSVILFPTTYVYLHNYFLPIALTWLTGSKKGSVQASRFFGFSASACKETVPDFVVLKSF